MKRCLFHPLCRLLAMLVGVLCSQMLAVAPASAADVTEPASHSAAHLGADDAGPRSSSLPLDRGGRDASEEREGTDDDDSDDDFDDDAQPPGSRRAPHRLLPSQPSFGLHRLIDRWTPVHLCLDPRPPRRA
jgi:hypothetical protein